MSKTSIYFDRNSQVMRCFGCGKTHSVMGKTARDPEAMYALKQQLTQQHTGCMAVPVPPPVMFKSATETITPSLTMRVVGPITCF
jgi:hypothetical protein